MLKIITDLSKRPFIRNVATVATGAVIAQAIVIAFSPVITRLYGPEAFGLLGVFTSITTMLIPVAALTYHSAIVLPADDRDAKGLLFVSLIITAGITCCVTGALLFFKSPILELLQIQAIETLVFLVPMAVFFSACAEIMRQWLIRKKKYKTTATIAVAEIFGINSTKTGIGFFWPTSTALIIIASFGTILHAFMLAVSAKKTLFLQSIKRPQGDRHFWRHIFSLVKQYRDFPAYRAPTVLLNAVTKSLPVLLLASLFGPASAGFYALGRRVLAMPGQIIGKAIGDVLYPRLARAAHSGENIRRLILRALLGKAALACVPYGLILLFGPWLFGFVFGEEWVTAGEYARWLALWNFCMFISQPCVLAVPILNMQGFFLVFQSAYEALRIASLYLGYFLFKTDVATISVFCSIGALYHIFVILFILKKASSWHQQPHTAKNE